MKASKLFCATAALCLAAAAARAETIKFTNFTPDTMGGETWQPGAGEAAPDAYFFYVDYATKYGGIRTSHYYMRHVRSIGGPLESGIFSAQTKDLGPGDYLGELVAAPKGSMDMDGSAYLSVNTEGFNTMIFGYKPLDFTGLSEDVVGLYVANSNLSYKDILNPGHAFGVDGDYLVIRINAYDASGALMGSVETVVADFREGRNFVSDQWMYVDLSQFENIATVDFKLDGQNANLLYNRWISVGGIEVGAVPEPAAAALILGALSIAFAARRRK